MDGVVTSKTDNLTSDQEWLIGTPECVWNIDLVCVGREASPNILSSVLKYKWKNNTFTTRSQWEQRGSAEAYTACDLYSEPTGSKKRQTDSIILQSAFGSCCASENAGRVHGCFFLCILQTSLIQQTFAFSILQCMQPHRILFCVAIKSLQAHNYHILGCLSNISKKPIKPLRKEDAHGHQSSPGIRPRPVIALKHMEK